MIYIDKNYKYRNIVIQIIVQVFPITSKTPEVTIHLPEITIAGFQLYSYGFSGHKAIGNHIKIHVNPPIIFLMIRSNNPSQLSFYHICQYIQTQPCGSIRLDILRIVHITDSYLSGLSGYSLQSRAEIKHKTAALQNLHNNYDTFLPFLSSLV